MTRNITKAVGVCALLVVVCIVIAAATRSGTMASHTGSSATPVAEFEATPTTGAAPLTVRFSDTSAGSPTMWKWSFGDGTTATGQSPSHVYTVAGLYTVSLIVNGKAGTHTLTKTNGITVSAPPAQPAWKTIIDDQFNTPGLPSHWLPYRGSYTGGVSSCADPSQVNVPGDGYLHLTMAYQTSGACGSGWYTGGMQIDSAYGGIDQAVTVRFRIVPAEDSNIVRSTIVMPMRWVDDPAFAWYQGEADYCEGSALNSCFAYLHYGPNHTQVSHQLKFDLTQWHTFRVEERNHKVTIFIDDMTTPVWVYNGNATTVPNAFRRTVFQQACALSLGCPSASFAGETEDVQIDWITIQNANETGDTQADTSIASHSRGNSTTLVSAECPMVATLDIVRIESQSPLTTLDFRSTTSAEPRRQLRT